MQTALAVTCNVYYGTENQTVTLKWNAVQLILLLSFKQSQFIAFVYYNDYWFINSTDDIQMKDSPAYDTVPQTQLVAV